MSLDFTKKTLVLITGASQGIGHTIAIELSKQLGDGSIILLTARSVDGLNNTKALIYECNPKIIVKLSPLDLSNATINQFEAMFNDCIALKFENAIIFHNAGSLGTLDKVSTYTDVNVWTDFYKINLFSVSLLNASFLNFARLTANHIYVVNISSLCGSQPFKNMGMYGTAKAARNLFFKVLALEESDVKVLNYSPGPVDTEMVSSVIANIKDDEMREMFSGLKENKTILSGPITVNKMLGILTTNEYKSGDLVDFYDRI